MVKFIMPRPRLHHEGCSCKPIGMPLHLDIVTSGSVPAQHGIPCILILLTSVQLHVTLSQVLTRNASCNQLMTKIVIK